MKRHLLFKSLLLLCALIVGTSAWAQETLWSEDFSSYSADAVPSGGTYSYACGNGSSTGTTKIYNENTAGGTKPEIMVCKYGGTFQATIPLENIAGNLTLTYKQNANSLTVSTPTTGVSISGSASSSTAGTKTVTFTGITKTMTSIVIKFTGPSGSKNVRLDDIVLTGNKASNVSAPTINTPSGFYGSTQSVTITTNETGGTTYYTTDGTSPDNTSTQYTGAISISSTTTLKAISYNSAGTEHSAVASATIAIAEDGVFDFVSAGEAGYDYGSDEDVTNDTEYYNTGKTTWTAGNVTMDVTGKYRWWYNGNDLRFYANDPASAAAFSVPNGYVITKIVTSGGSFSTASAGTLSGTTWTGASQSVTLARPTTGNSVNFTKFVVTYTTATQSATVQSYGWATYIPDFNVEFPANTAYIITAASVTSGLTLEAVTKAPAGTPLLLKGAGEKTATVIASADALSSNLLTISDGSDLASGSYPYVLAKTDAGGACFKQWTGAMSALNGRVMLVLDENIATARGLFDLDSETTAIETVKAEKANNEYYNLAGQRVAQLTKGLYIVNGKKVIIK